MLFLVSFTTHQNFSSLITPHRDYIDRSASELEEFNKNKPPDESGDESVDEENEKPSWFIHSSLQGGGEHLSWAMAMGESARLLPPPPSFGHPLARLPSPCPHSQ